MIYKPAEINIFSIFDSRICIITEYYIPSLPVSNHSTTWTAQDNFTILHLTQDCVRLVISQLS